MEIIGRTERRRKYSETEKAAILAEADQEGVTVRQVAERHEVAESLIYNWRSARRQAVAIAGEPLEFFSYGTVVAAEPVNDVLVSDRRTRRNQPEAPLTPTPAEELIRPFPGARPGAIDIDLPSGVRLAVDSYVNEKALARVLRVLRDVS
jgi:transposase